MSKVLWKAMIASPAVLGASLLISTSAMAAGVNEASAKEIAAASELGQQASAGEVATTKVTDFNSKSQPGSGIKDASVPSASVVRESKTLLALEPKPSKPTSVSTLTAQAQPASPSQLPTSDNSLAQVTSVSELSDVRPTDWAFQAVQSLVERYGCIEGYPDRTFRGNRAATRYELAAALNACLNQLSAQLGGITAEDLATIKRLQDEFAAELATLRGRVDALEARTDELEANQFSTTTKLTGEVIFQPQGVDGDFAEGVLDDDTGDDIDSNIFLGYRARLNFDASFTGEDRLRVRLQAADTSQLDEDITGTDMTRLNVDTDTNGLVDIDDLYYRFPLGDKGNVFIAAADTEFYDAIETFNPYLESEGQGALSRFARFNPIYRQVEDGTGAILNYDFTDAVGFSIGYLATTSDAIQAVQPADEAGAGLFSGRYAALAQLAIKPTDAIRFGLTYVRSFYPAGDLDFTGNTGSQLAQDPLTALGIGGGAEANHFGVEANFLLGSRVSIGGWVGYTHATVIDGPLEGVDANLLNYAVNLAFPDLGGEGNVAAIIFGQPPKILNTGDDFDIQDEDIENNAYHLEGLYRFKVTDNISITPGAFVIFNAENNDANDPVYVGVIRTTFTF